MSGESIFSMPFCATPRSQIQKTGWCKPQLQSCHLVIKKHSSFFQLWKSCYHSFLLVQSWLSTKASSIWPTACSILRAHSWDCQYKQTLAMFNTNRNALLHMLWDCRNPWQKIKCQFLSNQRPRNSICLF